MNVIVMILITIYVGAAWAHGPILTKSNHSGFVPVELARSEVCELYLDRLDITRQFASATIVESRTVTVTNIADVLTGAAEETLEETDNFICDAPQTSIGLSRCRDS